MKKNSWKFLLHFILNAYYAQLPPYIVWKCLIRSSHSINNRKRTRELHRNTTFWPIESLSQYSRTLLIRIMIPFSTFVVISLLSTLSPVSLGVRRFKSNLVLYGGYTTDVQRAVYTDSELEDWKNLSKVAEESRLGRKLLLCGVGDGAYATLLFH